MVNAKQLVVGEVTQALNLPAEHFSHQTNLYELGLHSMLILRLSERFSQQCGKHVSYLALASTPTVAAWIAVIQQENQNE